MERILLFDGQTSNGNSNAYPIKAGVFQLVTWSVLGGGTVNLEYSPDGGSTWIAIADFTTAVEGVSAAVYLPKGRVRAVLSGATSPAVSVRLEPNVGSWM